MAFYPLVAKENHLFSVFDEKTFLLDTGSPKSFASVSPIPILNQKFSVPQSFSGFKASRIEKYFGFQVHGLIGVDILNQFDVIFDLPNQKIKVSKDALTMSGNPIVSETSHGIPIIQLKMAGENYSVFFDTGAQISYFGTKIIENLSPSGEAEDFHPLIGKFTTKIYDLELELGGVIFKIRAGETPEVLAPLMDATGTSGVIGNEILKGRTLGYFPRQNLLCL